VKKLREGLDHAQSTRRVRHHRDDPAAELIVGVPRRFAGAALALLLSGALGACTASPNAPPQGSAGLQSGGGVSTGEIDASGRTVKWFEGTGEEYDAAVVTCLTAAGWDAVANQYGVSVPSVTVDQREEFERARDACDRQIGKLPPEPNKTKAEIGELYDYFVTTAAECVRDHGYRVDDPPSRDTYIEDYYTADVLWSIYGAVPDDMSQQDWETLNRDCPQDPEDAR
jgi:hypothetical protein